MTVTQFSSDNTMLSVNMRLLSCYDCVSYHVIMCLSVTQLDNITSDRRCVAALSLRDRLIRDC